MCTNFVPSRGSVLNERFGVTEPNVEFKEEAYPGYLAPIIRQSDSSQRQCDAAIFGLIPSWSKDGKNYRFCYNARSETVAEKPSFRNAWRKRQFCVVPVDAFYEPNYESGKAIRWRIEQASKQPMALAGIWESWKRPAAVNNGRRPGPTDLDLLNDNAEDDWVSSFSLLTFNADDHPTMRQFHRHEDEKRSVVLLSADTIDLWLYSDDRSVDHWAQILEASNTISLSSFASPKPRKTRAPLPPKPTRRLF
jgi:putative SOS response-associated peptidase YedK